MPGEVDPGQISQVIQNLILNARDAMSGNGIITINCDNYQPQEDDSLPLRGSNFIRITVEDQGTGIPKKLQDKIFDPYFTTKQTGNGLGLAITHSIIKKHGGHITVSSEQDRGATFTLYLPASEINPQENKQQPASVSFTPSPKTIMLMDDEEIVRKVATAMFEQLGHTVIQTSDGEEAIEMYRQLWEDGQAPDIVLMDLTIPGGMGGEETAKKLLDINSDAKIVVASGYSNDPVMANFTEYGFSAAITKPFQLQEIQNIISKLAT